MGKRGMFLHLPRQCFTRFLIKLLIVQRYISFLKKTNSRPTILKLKTHELIVSYWLFSYFDSSSAIILIALG